MPDLWFHFKIEIKQLVPRFVALPRRWWWCKEKWQVCCELWDNKKNEAKKSERIDNPSKTNYTTITVYDGAEEEEKSYYEKWMKRSMNWTQEKKCFNSTSETKQSHTTYLCCCVTTHRPANVMVTGNGSKIKIHTLAHTHTHTVQMNSMSVARDAKSAGYTLLPCNWRIVHAVSKQNISLKQNMLPLSCSTVCSLRILCILTSVRCPMGLFTWVQCKQCLTSKCKDLYTQQLHTATMCYGNKPPAKPFYLFCTIFFLSSRFVSAFVLFSANTHFQLCMLCGLLS